MDELGHSNSHDHFIDLGEWFIFHYAVIFEINR